MEIAGQHLTHTRLAELGIDHLRTLTYQTSETSVLAIRAGSHAICLRQVVSPMAERHAFRINELLPLHAGAGQRVLLAYAPRPVLEIALSTLSPKKGVTSDGTQLLDSLAAIRRNGYGRSHSELRAGAVAVSVPVIANGEIACSLTLAGPEARCDSEAWTRRAVRLLRAAADGLRDQLQSGAAR